MREGTDVRVKEVDFSVFYQTVGVFQVGFAFADGFDLSTAEGNAGLKTVGQEIIVAGSAILRGVPLSRRHGITRARGARLNSSGNGLAYRTGHLDV